MRITGPESEFMDGYHSAAKDDAAEFKRLDAQIAKLESERRELSVALRVIAKLAIEQQDDFMAANMRKIARDCLASLQIET